MGHRLRFWLTVSYLALAGWVCVILPWSRQWLAFAWSLPPSLAWLFTHPACRGAISGFGVLHFVVALTMATPEKGKP